MPHPLVGKEAPALSLPEANGETYTFEPGKSGVPIALFFYPKAGTYGCTKEACQFRDALTEKDVFKNSNVQVVGVSGDSVEKQKQFKEKQGLTYPILSDSKGEARKAYHVGKGLLGLTDARTTFVIDSKGIVREVLDATLNFGAHSKFVNKWLTKLAAEEKKDATEPTPAAAEETPAPVPEATEDSTANDATKVTGP
ncbi:hypothetical protein QCA50_014583 [Cerrena zonata]|uniref:thioredoxin-dependent peroxiredoxin n=1 Tax=Cerrena zonata TaxID=2478898 RepID=A0AAW0FN29_9APHY